jgi:predicted RND superfamily exporter protein
MRTQWITSWIIWLGQHKKLFSIFILLVSLSLMVTLIWVQNSLTFLFKGEAGLVLLSMLLMSLLAIKLLDSLKVAILLFVVMFYLYLISSGIFLIFGIDENEFSVFARVVVITLMMSHLIHFLAALLREMARGIHQYDAIIEALGITHQPILLSSLTTIFGFVAVSMFNEQYSIMAYQVILGVSLSYISLLVLVPTILLQWLLEFRVGNYNDRHGLEIILKIIKKYPIVILASKILVGFLIVFILVELLMIDDAINELLSLLLVNFLLLLVFWKKLLIATSAIFIALIAVIFAVTFLVVFGIIPQITPLILLVPIGIVLDDVVHFFYRYIRSEIFYITKTSEKIKFTLNSVGRSIWLTSQLLITGLVVLLFSTNSLVVQASLVTMLALTLISCVLLWLLPAIFSKD